MRESHAVDSNKCLLLQVSNKHTSTMLQSKNAMNKCPHWSIPPHSILKAI